jgi:hypothetical protein
MNYAASGIPNNWTLSNCDSGDVQVAQTDDRGNLDDYALKIVGAMSSAKSASQT